MRPFVLGERRKGGGPFLVMHKEEIAQISPGRLPVQMHTCDTPNAPTPTCPSGMTWDHSTAQPAYDTATGDLEIGDYAQQADATYFVHYPAMT